jgi:hypothetical protein
MSLNNCLLITARSLVLQLVNYYGSDTQCTSDTNLFEPYFYLLCESHANKIRELFDKAIPDLTKNYYEGEDV